jgi:3'-phosphoadenosine 5'-phosphosulfate sulfotransferase (PAPS reductase)/FAD synthetase
MTLEGDAIFRVPGPALISFSGGRTSAYMLRMILDAHGGTLPDDVHVCFANTGKEREETLRFVHECATRWGVRVRWIEWASSPPRRKKGEPKLPARADSERRFSEVGYNSASRNGEPFAAVIRSHQYLPNPAMRYCTTELKVRPMKHFMLAQGYEAWANAIGLRADEMLRVFKQIERNENSKERWQTVMPLATAKVRREDVLAFWRAQEFDLQLRPHEGNCDLCFLKARGSKAAIIRDDPHRADWWIAQEKFAKCSAPGEQNARFRADESIEQLRAAVVNSPLLPLDEDDEHDAECGTGCVGDG